jgi:hypothetical protein
VAVKNSCGIADPDHVAECRDPITRTMPLLNNLGDVEDEEILGDIIGLIGKLANHGE